MKPIILPITENMNDLIIPIRETVRIRFCSNTGITYIEWKTNNNYDAFADDLIPSWAGLIIPSRDLNKVIDALNKIEKLLLLK